MTVILNRSYMSYASGAIVSLPDSTEQALIAQGIARASTSQPTQVWPATLGYAEQAAFGGNLVLPPKTGVAEPAVDVGPRILPNVGIQAFASLGTNTTMVAGTLYRAEIFVPFVAQWTGIGLLNGATVGTDNMLVALYDSSGNFIQSSAVAGALSAGANAFQNRAFLAPVLLQPGRYFIGAQSNGTTATLRTLAAAMGGNQMTGSSTGAFGTLPTSFTPPTTFTADVGPIGWLYQS